MPALAGSFVDGNGADIGQVSRIHGQFDILGANGIHPMPRFAHDSGDSGKRHLPSQHQHQCLEHQREAGEFARPIRFDQRNPAVRQLDARHTDFEMALMLKEVQMPVALYLGVVNRVHTFSGYRQRSRCEWKDTSVRHRNQHP